MDEIFSDSVTRRHPSDDGYGVTSHPPNIWQSSTRLRVQAHGPTLCQRLRMARDYKQQPTSAPCLSINTIHVSVSILCEVKSQWPSTSRVNARLLLVRVSPQDLGSLRLCDTHRDSWPKKDNKESPDRGENSKGAPRNEARLTPLECSAARPALVQPETGSSRNIHNLLATRFSNPRGEGRRKVLESTAGLVLHLRPYSRCSSSFFILVDKLERRRTYYLVMSTNN